MLEPQVQTMAERRAFGLLERHDRFTGGWTTEARPRLLYAERGAVCLETARHFSVLPPGQAAWVPGGLRHRCSTRGGLRLRTVHFPTAASLSHSDAITVFAAPPLLREMCRQACDWGAEPPTSETVRAFFQALAGLVVEWAREPLPVQVPVATSPELRRALAHLLTRLERPVGLADAARAASVSERTLQRRCGAELGLSLSSWLTRVRILRAVELLADDHVAIGEVALSCGYHSPAAFTRAFTAQLNVTPSAWRQRTRAG